MAFGVYVHIPYCLQRCTYCDFATYERSKILPSSEYVDVVLEEMRQTSGYQSPRPLDTLYFGGGTPSLLPAMEIVSIIDGLEKAGYPITEDTEVTIEINPATVDPEKLRIYLDHGINRFSVGAQTFDDALLKSVHREHTARQTMETLDLLQSHDVNFSFDILFALPGQSVAGLEKDLNLALQTGASHLSPYCLTVPEGHPLSHGRPPEADQVEMFRMIEDRLVAAGFDRYEISNFARPEKVSRHNLLYWTDQEYWAIGLSAHGYRKSPGWGLRYWNESNIKEYVTRVISTRGQAFQSPSDHRSTAHFEFLQAHQSLTDFCHTSLRLDRGLDLGHLEGKFGAAVRNEVTGRARVLEGRGLVSLTREACRLTTNGRLLSNRVFEEFAFLDHEMPTLGDG